MKSLVLSFALLFLSHNVFATKPASAASATIKLEDARIFLPIKGSNVTAGFAKILNLTGKEVKVGIQDATPFKATEAHETVEKDGRMAMQKADYLVIPSKGSLELKPGSYHLMFFDPSREIKENEMIQVVLLVNGQPQTFEFKVVPRASSHQHH